MLARLSELMFVEAIRRYLETLPRPRPAGSRDYAIPSSDRRWRRFTVSRARRGRWRAGAIVGLSRSVFAERFTDMVGQPPMQYLALWRMQLASRLLVEGGQVRPWPTPLATNQRHSAAPSRSWWVRRRPRGGEGRRGFNPTLSPTCFAA